MEKDEDDIEARWDEYCLRVFGEVSTIRSKKYEDKKIEDVELYHYSLRCAWCKELLKRL